MKSLDLIIRLKNSARAQRREFVMPFSKLNFEIGKAMVKQGFLEDVKREDLEGKKMMRIKIAFDRRTSKFSDVSIISKPSLRKYVGKEEIKDLERRGRRILFISTSQGIMTGGEAQKKNLGGEVLFAIW